MQKIALALSALSALVVFASAATADSKTYTTKYDNIDVEQILKNENLLNQYFKCLLGEGKCTADGLELKKNLPDALANKCSKCSEKQKRGSERIINFLIDEHPKMWEKLEEKYDPKGIYRTQYKADAEGHGINLKV